jgi:hypothetical protein
MAEPQNQCCSVGGSVKRVFTVQNHSLIDAEMLFPPRMMDDTWNENVKNAIRLYMDKNDFYADKSDNLAPGNYHIYVQIFSKSDKDSIIFENENGSIYTGYYYSVHCIPDGQPENLNKVALNESSDAESYETYFEKVRSDPAVAMEYTAK